MRLLKHDICLESGDEPYSRQAGFAHARDDAAVSLLAEPARLESGSARRAMARKHFLPLLDESALDVSFVLAARLKG